MAVNPVKNCKKNIEDITLLSWNISGIKYNMSYLKNCLTNCDICFLQEHWLFPDSLRFLESVNTEFSSWGRACDQLNLDSLSRKGFGGVAFFWRKCLNVTRLDNLGNDRIMVVSVNSAPNNKTIFILGVYLPTSTAPLNSYETCLDILEDIILQLQDRGTIIIAGYFNAHIGSLGGPRSFSI